jgi:hypothetical protein
MNATKRGILIGFCVLLMAVTLVAQQMPQTKTQAIKGEAKVTTEELNGIVTFVEGNTLVVSLASGDIRQFNPPASRRFIVDGKELTLAELKPGTKLKATVTTTTTPVTERTTTVGSGKVWMVSGNTVILTLPNNENRSYKVADSYRFVVDGKKATVHELRKGMVVSAEKIVEAPKVEIASNTVVTGQAPPAPKPVVARTPDRVTETPAPAPVRAAEPAPAPVERAAAPSPSPTLPKTASPLPLVGLLGLLCTGAAFGLRTLRRFR